MKFRTGAYVSYSEGGAPVAGFDAGLFGFRVVVKVFILRGLSKPSLLLERRKVRAFVGLAGSGLSTLRDERSIADLTIGSIPFNLLLGIVIVP